MKQMRWDQYAKKMKEIKWTKLKKKKPRRRRRHQHTCWLLLTSVKPRTQIRKWGRQRHKKLFKWNRYILVLLHLYTFFPLFLLLLLFCKCAPKIFCCISTIKVSIVVMFSICFFQIKISGRIQRQRCWWRRWRRWMEKVTKWHTYTQKKSRRNVNNCQWKIDFFFKKRCGMRSTLAIMHFSVPKCYELDLFKRFFIYLYKCLITK